MNAWGWASVAVDILVLAAAWMLMGAYGAVLGLAVVMVAHAMADEEGRDCGGTAN